MPYKHKAEGCPEMGHPTSSAHLPACVMPCQCGWELTQRLFLKDIGLWVFI